MLISVDKIITDISLLYKILVISQVQTNYRPQFCKLLCQEGRWKGPFCVDNPHGLSGKIECWQYNCQVFLVQMILCSSMAVLCLMFLLVLRSGMAMTCWTWPRITSYHTPVHSRSGVMTWQLPCQVLPSLIVRMVSGHMTSQSVRTLLYKMDSQVGVILYSISPLSLLVYRFSATSYKIFCDWQLLGCRACWTVDCEAWGYSSLGLSCWQEEREP